MFIARLVRSCPVEGSSRTRYARTIACERIRL